MNPTVDVVIPTRNRERFLEACLRSVEQQTLQPKAVIVVDDGSTDGSVALLQKLALNWKKLVVIPTPPRGVSAARNTALAASTADLVAFIDSDDTWDPQKLEKQVALFTSNRPELSLVYCGLRRIDERGQPLEMPDVVPNKRGRVFTDILDGFYGIAPSTMVIRRNALRSIGGFDESLVLAEDRDLCLKLARVSEFDCISEALVSFRVHGESTYKRAMKHEPEFVLLQRLQVWNVWIAEIRDLKAVLNRFRREAAGAVTFWHFFAPRSGLYHRLRNSEIALARRLFPAPWYYFAAFARRPPRRRFGLTRDFAARHLIAPYPPVLRLAQRFGRLKGLSPRQREPGSTP